VTAQLKAQRDEARRNRCISQAATRKKGAVMKGLTIVRNFVTIALLLAFLIVLPAAHADEANQAIKVTFDRPVQIPGRVLPAGTYWFVLNNVNEHHVVSILNTDRTMVYSTLFTIDAERREPTSDTAFTFAERGSSQNQAILTWFYPGRTTGHEFLYPKQVQSELAKDKQFTIVAGK
jgi:hypothetical protein